MSVQCYACKILKATVKRPKNGLPVCKSCFINLFEEDVHATILKYGLLDRDETVAVGVSGGKDSSVVLHLLHTLNKKYDYGVHLVMVAIDEGIVGYRDHSLEAVHEQQNKYGLPLKILSYDQLFGWTMDKVVQLTGKRGNCTYCGVFRRQSLEKGAAFMGASKLVTGHNADDAAETILMNLLRGDIARLQRCTHPVSGARDELPRVKPLYFCYEKEIVLYARFLDLRYFATECIYAPNSYRGHARTFIKQLERIRPRSINDILISGQFLSQICKNLHNNNGNQSNNALLANRFGVKPFNVRSTCSKCGSISSQAICYACSLLDTLSGLKMGLRTDIEYIRVPAEEKKARISDIGPIEELTLKKSANSSSNKNNDNNSDTKSCSCKS